MVNDIHSALQGGDSGKLGGVSHFERTTVFPGLPESISLCILARVPFCCYGSLSLTCKSWQAVVSSNLLYHVRRVEGFGQKFLAVLPERSHKEGFQVYNPESDTWRCLKPLEMLRGEHAIEGVACCAVGRTLYILGGSQQGMVRAEVHAYDLLRGEWTAKAPMTNARSWFTCGVIHKGRGGRGPYIIAAGGQGRAKFLSTAEMYDVAADRWEPLSSMQVARCRHSGVVVGHQEEFWVVAGEVVRHDLDDRPLQARKGSAEVYSWESDTWRMVPEMWPDWKEVPSPLASVGSRLYTLHEGVLKHYCPSIATWTVCGSWGCNSSWLIRQPTRTSFAFMAAGKCLYACGGRRVKLWGTSHGHSRSLLEDVGCLEMYSTESESSVESDLRPVLWHVAVVGDNVEVVRGVRKVPNLTWRGLSGMADEGRGVVKAFAVLEI